MNVKRASWIAATALFLVAEPAVSFADGGFDQPLLTGLSWDFEVELGLGLGGGFPSFEDRLGVRTRAGIVWFYEPYIVTVGPTLELFGFSQTAAGAQVGLTHLWYGLWLNTGFSISGQPDVFFHVAGGLTLFGIEWQRSFTGAPPGHNFVDLWLLKVRIPIGIAVFGLTH